MINNATLLSFGTANPIDLVALEGALRAHQFVPCGSTQEKSIGFIAPRGEEEEALYEVVGGELILKVKIETKTVPAAFVREKLKERSKTIEAETGRKPGKKEKREIKEQIVFDELPNMPPKQVTVLVWLERKQGIMVLGANSQTTTDAVTTLLVKTIDGLQIAPLQTNVIPSAAMTAWLKDGEGPEHFEIDQECELRADGKTRSVIRYRNVPLDSKDIQQHVEAGFAPAKLALSWNKKISMIFTDTLQLKKISFDSAVYQGGAADRSGDFDADVAIFTGSLSQMLPNLMSAMGGRSNPQLAQ